MWHITDDDGLPSRTVYHTVQDNKGYIWIGTERGICRFDGKNFKTYKSEELNDNEILKVAVDPLGRIWFRNLSGQLFYIANEVIHNTEHLFPDELSNVNDFMVDGNTIWATFQVDTRVQDNYKIARLPFNQMGIFGPIYVYNDIFGRSLAFQKSDGSIYISLKLSNLRENNIALVQLDKESNILDIKNTMFLKYGISAISYYIFNEKFYLFSSKDQDIFYLELVQDKPKKIINFKKKTIINDILKLDDKFWMLTNEGIIIKRKLNDQTKDFVHLLAGKSTNHLMVDHEGNKWISTTGNGIHVITAPQTQVIHKGTYNLPNDEVYSMAYDHSKGKLLLGHGKGQISIINNNFENQIINSDPSGRIVEILVLQSGNYWFVNESELIIFSADLTIKNPYGAGIKTLLQAKNKDIWAGSFDYTYRFPQKNIDIFSTQNIKRLREDLLSKRTYALYQDNKNHVWIGTANGLYVYQDTVRPFLENKKHISYNISSINQSIDTVIWVGTRGDGLIRIKNKKVIQRIKEENGLASNTIKKVFATPDHLWIATDNGLNKIDLKSQEITWINTTDGLPSNDINDIEVVDDKVWVATAKGLANFSINAQHKNEIPPPIYISNIKIVEKDTILHDSFSLSYDQNSIQIDMVGIGYKGKGDISYEYKLSGLEDYWVQTNSQFARYPNLSPGEYIFEVFAVNEDQVKSSQPASVYFSIQPPWWKTWWFRVLCFFSIGGTIAYWGYARKQRLQQEQQFLDHVKELKTKALRSQMNPHFVFNALNAIQKFLTTNDREQAMNYLSNFGKLIRLVFDHSQVEKITLEEEIDFLKLYLDLEKLRFMDAIDIQLEVSTDLQKISDEIHLPPLLIQPIIENSFKHGFLYKKEPGILSIKFSRKGAFLICNIEDNGIGRKAAAALGQKTLKDRPSSGLKTSEERLNILKSNQNTNTTNIEKSELNFIDLYDTNGNVKGTLVKIKIYCSDLEPTQEL